MFLCNVYTVNSCSVDAKQGNRTENTGIRKMCAPVPAEHIVCLTQMYETFEGIVIAQGAAFFEGFTNPFVGRMQDNLQFIVLIMQDFLHIIFPYTMDGIIIIPQSATVEIQDKKFVFVLQADNSVKNTEIQISNLDDGKNYLVTNGLKSGDKIVIEGVQNLHDGQAIQPITPEQQEAKYDQALKDQNEGKLKTAFN